MTETSQFPSIKPVMVVSNKPPADGCEEGDLCFVHRTQQLMQFIMGNWEVAPRPDVSPSSKDIAGAKRENMPTLATRLADRLFEMIEADNRKPLVKERVRQAFAEIIAHDQEEDEFGIPHTPSRLSDEFVARSIAAPKLTVSEEALEQIRKMQEHTARINEQLFGDVLSV